METDPQRRLKRPPRVFSEQFVVYVQREMERCTGASEEERFQIHREVFQYLIEQFGEHRGILCDIKAEYDAAIKRRDAHIRRLQDIECQLSAERQRHSRRLQSAKMHAYKEVEVLQEEQAQLRHRLSVLCEERHKLQSELEEVRETLLVEQRRYREEHKVRQLAEADLDDVTQRYNNLLHRVSSRPPPDKQSSNTADDPVVLRVALTKCREELSAVSARLLVMETSYTEVVPRRDLVLARVETERVRASGKEKLAELEQLLQQERETEVYRTPRPDWARASAFIPGGDATWVPLRGDLPSTGVMMALLGQLSAPGQDVFTGLGMEDQTIPIFLRWQGDIKNMRMTRWQIVHIICDIFESKEANEDPFQVFVFEYFKERYPFSWHEWTYSFHFALERLTSDDSHHLLLGLQAPAVAEASPPLSRQSVSQSTRSGSILARAESSAPTVDASGRALSQPERLQFILEDRQQRISMSEEAPARPGSGRGTAPGQSMGARSSTLSVEEEQQSRVATASVAPPSPEVQNRRIELFWNVLYGVQHESVYNRDRSAIQQLKKEFLVADAEKQGKVLYDSLGRIISETYFGIKTDEEVQRLVLAAAFGDPEMDPVHAPAIETVNYSHFLDTCRETDSAFLQEFYQQADRAGAAYADQLLEMLSEEELIQPIAISQAVSTLTPDVAVADVERMSRWVCPEEGQAVPLKVFVDRLKGLPLPPEKTAAGDAGTP